MPIKNKQGQQWEVKDGRAVLVTPAVKEKVEQVPAGRLDRELARTARRKARAVDVLSRAQEEVDALTTYETSLLALRATVTDGDEPD